MAYQAGAEVTDLEFIQFHPTALYLKKAPRFLLSEALRGEGAYLRNMEMLRFMAKYHPMAELAPRDVVARAIMHELERSRAKDPVVYLDMTHLDEAHIRRRSRVSTRLVCSTTWTSRLSWFQFALRPTTRWAE